MKQFFITILSLAGMISAQAQAPASKADIQFTDESHDFGNIHEGTQAAYEFKFKNTGTEPLVLTDVHASCGCTTPEWPKEPVAPGATAVIKAIYNSTGRPGQFSKSITVTSNAASGQKILTFRGIVEPSAIQPDVVPPPPLPAKVDNIPEPVSIKAPQPTPVKPTPKASKTPVKYKKTVKSTIKTSTKVQPKS